MAIKEGEGMEKEILRFQKEEVGVMIFFMCLSFLFFKYTFSMFFMSVALMIGNYWSLKRFISKKN